MRGYELLLYEVQLISTSVQSLITYSFCVIIRPVTRLFPITHRYAHIVQFILASGNRVVGTVSWPVHVARQYHIGTNASVKFTPMWPWGSPVSAIVYYHTLTFLILISSSRWQLLPTVIACCLHHPQIELIFDSAPGGSTCPNFTLTVCLICQRLMSVEIFKLTIRK